MTPAEAIGAVRERARDPRHEPTREDVMVAELEAAYAAIRDMLPWVPKHAPVIARAREAGK